MWLLSILACDDPDPSAQHVTPWLYEEAAERTAPLAADALAASLPAAVATLRRVDPLLTHTAFLGALGAFDASCPHVGSHNGQLLREGDCVAANGARYFGYELQTHLQDAAIDFPGAEGLQRDFYWMTGNSRLELPDGTTIVLGGDSMVSDRIDREGRPRFSVYLWGSFRREGTPVPVDWFDENLGVEVRLDAIGAPDVRVATWDGGVTGLAGDLVAFRLDDLTFDAASGCAAPVGGRLALYGRDARWVDVAFDESCDGCADLVRDGEVVTRACADWSPFLSWARSPWE